MARRFTVQRLIVTVAMISIARIAIAAACFFVDQELDARARRQFDAVQMNAKAQDVAAAMGRPDRSRPCGENLWWGGDGDYRGKNDGRCVTEVRYEHFLSAWAIGYSADGRVVSKYHYFSD